MAEHYALGAFLARWYPSTRHDLAASESETWQTPDLLALADPQDRARWQALDFSYTDPRGAVWLRDRVAAGYAGIDVDQVVCFAGAQEALGIALRALVEPGDHAIMVLPAYQPSEYALSSLCDTTGIVLEPDHAWALDLNTVAAAIRPTTRVMLINFPNNPTGKLLSLPTYQALIVLCRQHGIWVVNDEVYRGLDRTPALRLPCVADAYERGVSVDALSKGYGLPGLRVGWLACQDHAFLARTRALKHIASLCLAGPSEVLAHIALGARETLLARNRAIADENLALLRRLIAAHPTLFDWHEPDGGVVGYVRYCGPDGVEAFATRMAREAEALILPSSVWRSALAPTPSDRFRIGFGRRAAAAGIADIAQALHRDRTRSAA